MRRVVIITIVALFCSPLWALTYMGPPTSNVKEGDFILGFDYSDSESDIEWSGYGDRGTIKDVEGNLYLGKVGLGIADGFEFFGRFGTSEIEDAGNEFAWGLGTKATFGKKDNISWGALFQYMSLYAEDTQNIGGYLLDGDLDVQEFQFAIGPTYQINELSIYGGPFLHFIEGDVDLNIVGSTYLYDIEQESEFGGYAGIGWQISENSSLHVEYQFTDDAQAIGISLYNRFGNQTKSGKPVIWQKPKIHTDAFGQAIDGTAYKVKRDESGEIMKDEKGHFVFEPVLEE
jgi:hypothetical protein